MWYLLCLDVLWNLIFIHLKSQTQSWGYNWTHLIHKRNRSSFGSGKAARRQRVVRKLCVLLLCLWSANSLWSLHLLPASLPTHLGNSLSSFLSNHYVTGHLTRCWEHSHEWNRETISCFTRAYIIVNTGIPHFIMFCCAELHRYCIFYFTNWMFVSTLCWTSLLAPF